MMDKIHNVLERHERWIETLQPHEGTVDAVQHWEIIMRHIQENLDAHEKFANVMNIREGKHLTQDEERDRHAMGVR